ncbi:hypothetical protein BATDEDRAFT_36948 [Batrachochytrium dendrobatidis JAM81]|uniref:Uncharacterized protein n=4 Tax=Batrachochytrium dendrobatidis TaxID=109871 RepID=F4P2R9_BATDJ|nr:uncharacterized protein BATDEDRAFT_36948 [Batrachochytrium dendrobatidis JAM81]EGF80069.1 hypothetical protein BATDEDRAFT_36948 [Batrachochytrium dendrobatidis JAM81]|eukprot:XP_006679132.1 hypothetical protein BATDEDRAFT_36948 [Batrachochytrium dendrobatidis JAM81]
MSLQELFDVMSATSEYMSMLPVQPAAVAGTLELLDGSLILKLMVEEGIDFQSLWPADKASETATKKFLQMRKLPALALLADVVSSIRKELVVLDSDAHYRWFNPETDSAILDSPKFLKALTTAIVKCVASRTFESSDNKVEVPSPELYAAEKELMTQFVKMMMPYLVSNESKIEVLKASQTFCTSKKFPNTYFHDLMRMYHELDLIETSVFSNYLESIPLSSKIAHGIVQTWVTQLESDQ